MATLQRQHFILMILIWVRLDSRVGLSAVGCLLGSGLLHVPHSGAEAGFQWLWGHLLTQDPHISKRYLR